MKKYAIITLGYLLSLICIFFAIYNISSVTIYRFPPELVEWFFVESPEEIEKNNSPFARFDKNGWLIVVAGRKTKSEWWAATNPENLDLAMQNKNIKISSDMTHISVLCYNNTWEEDFTLAEKAAMVCVAKKVIDGFQPTEVNVTIDLVDGNMGTAVFQILYPTGEYEFYPEEIFSFMKKI